MRGYLNSSFDSHDSLSVPFSRLSSLCHAASYLFQTKHPDLSVIPECSHAFYPSALTARGHVCKSEELTRLIF